MNYTILYTKDLATEQVVDITKDGNTFVIGFAYCDNYISNRVKTIEEAKKIYNNIINCFINGLYNFEDRKRILLNEKEI